MGDLPKSCDHGGGKGLNYDGKQTWTCGGCGERLYPTGFAPEREKKSIHIAAAEIANKVRILRLDNASPDECVAEIFVVSYGYLLDAIEDRLKWAI